MSIEYKVRYAICIWKKYNKITIAEKCINTTVIYIGEYQLKIKQSTKGINNLINVCPEFLIYAHYTFNN